MSNENHLTIYYEARNVCIRMMNDRKYVVPLYLNITKAQFDVLLRNNDMDLKGITYFNKLLQINVPVYVAFISPDEQFSRAENKTNIFNKIAQYLQYNDVELMENDVKQGRCHIMIVYNAKNQASQNKFEQTYNDYTNIQIFDVNKLAINVLNHTYQSKFRLLETDERNVIVRRLGMNMSQFPTICFDDPVNKYYNGHIGDMYEIVREGTIVVFKVVSSRMMNLKNKK